MTWKAPLQLCASILAGAGLMTWEIVHNIESLLIKEDNRISKGFDFTTDEIADSSHDLAECLQVRWLDEAWKFTDTEDWQKTLWSIVPSSLILQFSKALSSPLALRLSVPQKFLAFLQEFDDDDVRILGTQVLASLKIHDEVKTQELNELVASCDNRILIGLARLPGLDTRLLGVHRTELRADAPPESIESDLKALLLKLPLTGLDPCTTWFTRNAILTGKSASQHRRPVFWSFSGESLSFAHSLSSMPAEQVELYYLKALNRHSVVPSHRSLMVESGVLDVISREIKNRFHSLRIKREIGLLLGNLALEESTHDSMVEQGLLPLLRSWLYSDDLALFSHAVRTLANLDRDFCKDETYEDGVYLLHPQGRHSSSSIDADVVFVHGLRGGPFMTWRQQEEKGVKNSGTDCWPKSWLVGDIPSIRVLMLEYDTSLSHWVAQCPQKPETQSLLYRSEEIRRKLRKAGVGKRPVIWIVHSMGGLLVKQLLLDAEKDDEFRSMCDNTKGIVFYSTPHLGSALASYSTQASHLLLPSVEVKELCQKSPFLATLHENFLSLVQRHPVKLLSFGETMPVKLSWMLQTILVTNDSADLGVGEFLPLDVDHVDICKPSSKTDERYTKTAQFIQNLIAK